MHHSRSWQIQNKYRWNGLNIRCIYGRFDSKSNRTADSIRDSIRTQKNDSQVPIIYCIVPVCSSCAVFNVFFSQILCFQTIKLKLVSLERWKTDVCGLFVLRNRVWFTLRQSWITRISTRKCWSTLRACSQRMNRSTNIWLPVVVDLYTVSGKKDAIQLFGSPAKWPLFS